MKGIEPYSQVLSFRCQDLPRPETLEAYYSRHYVFLHALPMLPLLRDLNLRRSSCDKLQHTEIASKLPRL